MESGAFYVDTARISGEWGLILRRTAQGGAEGAEVCWRVGATEQSAVFPAGGEAFLPCPGVSPWEPGSPALYTAEVTVSAGESVARICRRVGFRSIERRGRTVLWNGRPVKLFGICYREKPGDREGSRRDLDLFSRANVNFIRALSPFSEEMLDLCDEMGFFVENCTGYGKIGNGQQPTQNLPHLRGEYLARGMQIITSHPCVLLYSLGQDCAWGSNFRAMARMIRAIDPARLIAFHLPMSVPEEESIDVWPVHYVDWRQRFDACYDSMEILNTSGCDNEIGYMTAISRRELPVIHEIWCPVVCHNGDEIRRDPSIRDVWGESVSRFAEIARETDGCLGGAVLAGVDETRDGVMWEWGVLDEGHRPKPEYAHLRDAYTSSPVSPVSSAAHPPEFVTASPRRYAGSVVLRETEDDIIVLAGNAEAVFDKANCELRRASAQGRTVIEGGPILNTQGLEKAPWRGATATARQVPGGVIVELCGSYPGAMDVVFRILCRPLGDGMEMETSFCVTALRRHMPHAVKADTGVADGGLCEKGISWILPGALTRVISGGEERRIAPGGLSLRDRGSVRGEMRVTDDDGYGVCLFADGNDRLEEHPLRSSVIDDRDPRMEFVGDWYRVRDIAGDYAGTETASRTAGDEMRLRFFGTGIRLIGPKDLMNGLSQVYLDGKLAAYRVSQAPDSVDVPGMSRGYEKRYGRVLFCATGLPEAEHLLTLLVLGEECRSQGAYAVVDCAIVDGGNAGYLAHTNTEFNYPRMVRGLHRMPPVLLREGVWESCRVAVGHFDTGEGAAYE